QSALRQSAARAGRDAVVLQGLQERDAVRERRQRRIRIWRGRPVELRGRRNRVAGISHSELLTGGHAINGNTSSGGDQINNVSLNGVLNVQSFGAACSNTTASATTTASNPVVTVGAI